MAAEFRCLCDVAGGVSGYGTGATDRGKPRPQVADWQQGIALVTKFPDGTWAYEPIRIRDGIALFRGKLIDGDPKVVE